MNTSHRNVIITGTTVESKDGAALKVEKVQLSEYAQKLLRAGSRAIGADDNIQADAVVQRTDETR